MKITIGVQKWLKAPAKRPRSPYAETRATDPDATTSTFSEGLCSEDASAKPAQRAGHGLSLSGSSTRGEALPAAVSEKDHPE